MRMICLILIVVGIAGAGMCLVDVRNKKDTRLQLAWSSALLGWGAALIGFLF